MEVESYVDKLRCNGMCAIVCTADLCYYAWACFENGGRILLVVKCLTVVERAKCFQNGWPKLCECLCGCRCAWFFREYIAMHLLECSCWLCVQSDENDEVTTTMWVRGEKQ